ncbi:MAG TPA: hypothetical protein VN420_00340 [Candidatus Fimivivens sp.]|nr:hypothetical protein [Candidatus Fimivivens sp.]
MQIGQTRTVTIFVVLMALLLGLSWLSYVAPSRFGAVSQKRNPARIVSQSSTVPVSVPEVRSESENAPDMDRFDDVLPTAKSVRYSGEMYEWMSFPYDTIVGDVSEIGLPMGFLSRDVPDLVDNPSCAALGEFATRDRSEHPDGYSVQLPNPFYDADSMCGFVRRGDSVLFYILGKAFIHETLPYLESDLLLIGKGDNGWLLEYPVSKKALNLKYEMTTAAYVREHPETEFPNADFSKLYTILEDEQSKDLKMPTAELEHLFRDLQTMAEFVELPQ